MCYSIGNFVAYKDRKIGRLDTIFTHTKAEFRRMFIYITLLGEDLGRNTSI